MKNTLLLTLVVSSMALAQNIQVQTDRGTLDVAHSPGTLQVKSKTRAPAPAPAPVDDEDTAVPAPAPTQTTEVRVNGQTIRVEGPRSARRQSAEAQVQASVDALEGHSTAWTVDGQGKRLEHRCAIDEDVNVTGQSNQVVLSGPCRNVWVSGHGNRVTVEQAGLIDASGFKNLVWWRAGLSGDPRVFTSGFDNAVTRQQ
jgi:hypothetical protein